MAGFRLRDVVAYVLTYRHHNPGDLGASLLLLVLLPQDSELPSAAVLLGCQSRDGKGKASEAERHHFERWIYRI